MVGRSWAPEGTYFWIRRCSHWTTSPRASQALAGGPGEGDKGTVYKGLGRVHRNLAVQRGQEDRKIKSGTERGAPREGRLPQGCRSLGGMQPHGDPAGREREETLRRHPLPTLGSCAKPLIGCTQLEARAQGVRWLLHTHPGARVKAEGMDLERPRGSAQPQEQEGRRERLCPRA